MKYYSELKRNDLSSHSKTWDLKYVLLSVKGQSEKSMYCIIQITWHSGKGNDTIENTNYGDSKLINGF